MNILISKTMPGKSKFLRIPIVFFCSLSFFILFSYQIDLLSAQSAKKQFKDENITQAVVRQLKTDEEVSSHLIDVQTKDGVVILSGSVYSLLQKDRAAYLAETIKGVRSVVNNIEVKPTKRPDKEILKSVKAALRSDPATDTYDITANVNDGVVILRGTVESWQEKQLASKVVKGVKGVKSVDNNLEIKYKEKHSDKEIKELIKRCLHYDVRVDAEMIGVDVENGRVRLFGSVGSAAEKRQAIMDAWGPGVKAVNSDDLIVEFGMRDKMQRKGDYKDVPDEEIRKAVEEAFQYDPRLEPFQIDVSVEDNQVRLSGIVNNLKAKRSAERDAMNTYGVSRVKNFIKVRPKENLSDKAITQEVIEAFIRDPYLEPHEINVEVKNGEVYLTGTVDSYFQKVHAKEIAVGVKGITEVNNNLDISATWPWKSDWEIKEDVEDELYWEPIVDSENITVKVEDGVVTLKGSVRTARQKREATREAFEAGAKRVMNDLEVMKVFIEE